MSFIISNQKYILGLVFVLIFTWENLLPQRIFSGLAKHNIKNFIIGAVNLVISFIGGVYFSKYLDWFSIKHPGLLNLMNVSATIKMVLAILIADILMYWWHRLNHTIAFLWLFHSFHHLDLQMNSTTAIRFHLIELVLSFLFRMVWYPLLGINSLMVIIFSTIHFSMIIFHHSNIRLPLYADKLIRLFITSPGMHRIHHSNRWEETNSNYTSILSCWDWVFGSYVSDPVSDIKFGVPPGDPVI